MKRRSFLTALAALVVGRRYGPTIGMDFSATPDVTTIVPISHIVTENHIILDGTEMKRWINRVLSESRAHTRRRDMS